MDKIREAFAEYNSKREPEESIDFANITADYLDSNPVLWNRRASFHAGCKSRDEEIEKLKDKLEIKNREVKRLLEF